MILTGVLVHGLGEQVDEGRGLEALVEDAALTLEPHVLGELDKAAHVALRLDIVAHAKVLGTLLKERVLLLLGLTLAGRRSGGSSLGTLGLNTTRKNVSHNSQMVSSLVLPILQHPISALPSLETPGRGLPSTTPTIPSTLSIFPHVAGKCKDLALHARTTS